MKPDDHIARPGGSHGPGFRRDRTFRDTARRSALLVVACASGAIAAPPNDDCANATLVGPGQHAFTNVDATTDGQDDSACLTFGSSTTWNDVWFRFEAAASGLFVASTCGLVDFDSRISIYQGDCPIDDAVTGAMEVACNDDGEGCPGYSSHAQVPCEAGDVFLVRVGSYLDGLTGSGVLDCSVQAPCMDGCDPAAQMELEPCGASTNDGCYSNALAAADGPVLAHEMIELDRPVCGTWFSSGELRDTDWYIFEVPEPGAMVAASLRSPDSVVGYLYFAEIQCPLVLIDYQYGACPTAMGGRWLTPGAYRVIVAPGFESTTICQADGPVSRYELEVYREAFEVPRPANDDCSEATVVGDGIHEFSNFYSTTDGPASSPDDCSLFGPSILADVWFEYEATCDGTATVSTCDTVDFDSRIEVWSGGCEGGLLACNDDGPDCESYTSLATFPVQCGERYLVRLGGYQGDRGSGTVTFSCDGGCCPGDFDGDGQVSGSDLASLLGAWGSSDPLIDLTADGLVSGADLAALLGRWGACQSTP